MSGADSPASRRGAVPVAHLAALPQVEAGAVACLRLWCDSVETQGRLWQDFSSALGARPARDALKAFERMVGLLARHGRRPLMRHGRECACVGADEAAFAILVAAAADGEREDAALMAALLVRPVVAADLADLAGVFGRAIRRMASCGGQAAVPACAVHPGAEILH